MTPTTTDMPSNEAHEEAKATKRAEEEAKNPKEKVGLPVKMSKEFTEKTGIICMFNWTPRRDRRKKYRARVREKSPETFHPAHKKERAERYYAIRTATRLMKK